SSPRSRRPSPRGRPPTPTPRSRPPWRPTAPTNRTDRTPMATSRAKQRKSPLKSLIELVLTVAIAVGLALLIQAFIVKPYRIPSPSMVPTLAIGQRVLTNRLFSHPSVGDIVVFHPRSGSFDAGLRRQSRRWPPAAVRKAHSADVLADVHQAGGRAAWRHDHDHRRPRDPQRRRREGLVHQGLRGRFSMHFPQIDRRSARRLLHDGRQPWRFGRQPLLGTSPWLLDHRCRLLHLLAAGPDRLPLSGRGRGASHGRVASCFSSTARSAPGSWPAPTKPAEGASPGRWSPRRSCSIM